MESMKKHFVPNIIRVTERSLRVMQAAILTWQAGFPVVSVMENEVNVMQFFIDEESELHSRKNKERVC